MDETFIIKEIRKIINNLSAENISTNDYSILKGLYYIFNAKKNDVEIDEWITVKGNHIPILKGQTKEEAIKDFIEQKHYGGYSERNKSNRSIAAELEGKDNISSLAKKLGVKSSDINGVLYSDEWHHTNKNYTKTKYYYTDAYLDLKEKGQITQKTIDKYDLNEDQIKGIVSSWEKLKQRSKKTPGEILTPYLEKYKKDTRLIKILKEAQEYKRSSQWQNGYGAAAAIRRYLEDYKNGEDSLESLDRLISFYSTAEKEKRIKQFETNKQNKD